MKSEGSSKNKKEKQYEEQKEEESKYDGKRKQQSQRKKHDLFVDDKENKVERISLLIFFLDIKMSENKISERE